MADQTITSANSVFTLTIPGLFAAPILLEGYAADRMWDTESLTVAEIRMGADGFLTGGYVPNPVPMNIHFLAASPSKVYLNALGRTIQANREIMYISGTIVLPSTGESFILTKGLLTKFKTVPDAAKLLEDMDYEITWQSVQPTLS